MYVLFKICFSWPFGSEKTAGFGVRFSRPPWEHGAAPKRSERLLPISQDSIEITENHQRELFVLAGRNARVLHGTDRLKLLIILTDCR